MRRVVETLCLALALGLIAIGCGEDSPSSASDSKASAPVTTSAVGPASDVRDGAAKVAAQAGKPAE